MAEKTIPGPTEGNQDPAKHEKTRGEERYITPPVDIFEEGETLKVVADLPGVDTESIDIRVDDNVLTIQAATVQLTPGKPVYREYELANYFRQFELSDALDTDRITADLRHGVLTLTLPKAEKTKPRQIAINVS
ncbi:MAG: Hsp20/alpha crystallin family protein [bacterium]